MDKRSVALALFGVVFLSYVWGWLVFDMTFFALTSVVAGGGLLAAVRFPRTGLGVAAAMCLTWVIGFVPVGISVLSTVAAGAITVGFALMAVSAGGRPVLDLVGVGLAAAGHGWYALDNVVSFPEFGVGNLVFLAAAGLFMWAVRTDAHPAAVEPVAAPATAPRKAANTSLPRKTAKRSSAK